MNTINPANAAATQSQGSSSSKFGFGALGMEDFVRLLTTELQQQDPTNPADNKDMLAQMAQFSSLSGIDQTNSALAGISARLDTLIAAQQARTDAV